MTNLEKNALRIAELLGKEIGKSNVMNFCYIAYYSSYNGLMPIVFEIKKSLNYNIELDNGRVIFVYRKNWITTEYEDYDCIAEPEFIEAIQKCIIKYLELKKEQK